MPASHMEVDDESSFGICALLCLAAFGSAVFGSAMGSAFAPAMAQTNEKAIKIVAAENFYGDIAQQLAGE